MVSGMENGNHLSALSSSAAFLGGADADMLDFQHSLSIFKRRAIVIVGATLLGGLLGGLLGKANPIYQGEFQILTKPITVESAVVSSLNQSIDKKGTSTTERGFDGTKARMLYSPTVLDPVFKQVLAQYPNMKYENLMSNIELKAVPETEVVTVRYKDTNPERVTTVMQLLSDRYVNYSLEERRAETDQGLKFIDSQLPELENKVRKLQQRLQDFRQQYTFFDPESQNREIADQITTFRKQRLDAEVQLKQARALYGDLQEEIDAKRDDRTAGTALRQSPGYQKLLDQLLVIDGKLAQDSAIYLPESENIKILQDERSQIVSLMEREATRARDEVGSQVRDLEAKNTALARTESDLSQRLKDLSGLARQYTEIQSELGIATENLNQFLAKKSTLQINNGQQVTPWQNISKPSQPQLVSLRSNALLGSVLGLLLGLGSALLIDRLINVFYNSDEVKRASKLPMLGIIPYNRELPQLESSLSSRPSQFTQLTQFTNLSLKPTKFGMMPFLEAFRMLTTNLRLTYVAQPLRSIVITSALPEDGKSTIVTYLAQAAASMGQRVLIVDADLRVPQQHYRLGVSNQQGLSQALLSSRDVSEFIQPWALNPNVQVLTAGQVPQDPITLLASQKMKDLMGQLSQNYDLVIYDAPPLCGLSDAHLVAAHSDGLILVTRLKKTKREALDRVLETLRQLPTRVLGVVVNDSRQVSASLHRGYYSMNPIVPMNPAKSNQPTQR